MLCVCMGYKSRFHICALSSNVFSLACLGSGTTFFVKSPTSQSQKDIAQSVDDTN